MCAPRLASVAAAGDVLTEQPLHQVEHGPHRAPRDRAHAERRDRQQSHPVHRARVGDDRAPVRSQRKVGQPDGEVPTLLLHPAPNRPLERLGGGGHVRAVGVPYPSLPVHITRRPPSSPGSSAAIWSASSRGTPLGATRPSTTAPSRPWALVIATSLPPLLALIRRVRISRGGSASP